MKKKKLKGFTLIELIIVMAIVSIIMAAVMILVDPVSKMMKKASIQEANSAAVDNVKRYIEGNLRHATAIEAHLGALTDIDGSALDTSSEGAKVASLEKVAKNFADQYYLNRAKDDNTPYQGKIHVLEIDNTNAGRINEYTIDFEAGYTVSEPDALGNFTTKVNVWSKLEDWDHTGVGADPTYPAYIKKEANVINPTYYEDYSFFIEPGYKDLSATDIAASDSRNYVAELQTIERDRVNVDGTPVLKADGTIETYTVESFTPNMFAMSIVTYKNSGIYPKTADDPSTTEDETRLFESPAAVSNISMSLVNVNSNFKSANNLRTYYGPVRYNGTGTYAGAPNTIMTPSTPVDLEGNDGNWDYKKLDVLLTGSGYTQNQSLWSIKNTNEASSPNLYFVYTLPDAL